MTRCHYYKGVLIPKCFSTSRHCDISYCKCKPESRAKINKRLRLLREPGVLRERVLEMERAK